MGSQFQKPKSINFSDIADVFVISLHELIENYTIWFFTE